MKTGIKILIIAFLPLSLGAKGPEAQCLGGMREELIKGSFSGPLICAKKDAAFVLVGRTTGVGYAVYNYRYRFIAAAVYHGGQRLVIFRGKKYVGQYMLEPPVTAAVRGHYVLLQGDEDRKAVKLDFSRTPPIKILVNGASTGFGR